MADYGTFGYGGASYPLATSTANGLLRDSDPALYYVLDYFQSVLNTYLNDRLVAQAEVAGVPIEMAVKQYIPLDAAPYVQEQQIGFPLLAIYRVKSEYSNRTVTLEKRSGEWNVDYVLPPMNGAQAEQLLPILKSVGDVLHNRIENMFDPSYQSGAEVWKLAGVERINLVSDSFGYWEVSNELKFPVWTAKLKVDERITPAVTINALGNLTGIDVIEDLADPILPTVPDVADFKFDIADPTAISSLVALYRGDAGITLAPDGYKVSAWANQGTLANNAVQATSLNQPSLIRNAIVDKAGESKAVLRFDGQYSYLVSPATQLANDSGRTFVVLCRLSDTLKRGSVLMNTLLGDTGAASAGIEANTASSVGGRFGFFANNSTFDSPAITNGEWHIVVATITSTTGGGSVISTTTYQMDGSVSQTLTLRSGSGNWGGMSTANQLAIGALPASLGITAFAGDVGVAMAFSSALSASDMKTAVDFCKQWAGIS